MNVNIDEGFREFIEKKIKSSEYATADEVVAAALTRWAVDEMNFEPGELDALLKPAIEQLERGEGIPIDDAMKMVRDRIKEKSAKRLGA